MITQVPLQTLFINSNYWIPFHPNRAPYSTLIYEMLLIKLYVHQFFDLQEASYIM